MNHNQENFDLVLGFLSLYKTSNRDGYIGAILITDFQGVPQEFRCTHPIKPTNLQKTLYGDTLEPHIGVTLCGIPLIESVQNRPSLIMVDRDFLLNLRLGTLGQVVFIGRDGGAIKIKPCADSEHKSRIERVTCLTGRFQPILITPHCDYHDDANSAKEILQRVFAWFDPIEMFGRMEKAIELLGKQDKTFQ